MSFSSPSQPFNMSEARRPTSLRVRQVNVFAGHALFVDFLIQVMPSLPVTCGVMLRYAGVAMLLMQPMAPVTSKQRVRHCLT